jgi:EAL domain-containing protein (putative c-di-GMP-specific phosphodiesterase class I)
VADAMLATRILGELRDLGVAVALDDFGTGYSSLSHLQELPITTVKVDRSFVSRVDTDAGAAAIVKAVIGLSHSLGLQVIAEGIESDAQLRLLQAMGCDIGQGFLFAHPLPADVFRALLATRSGYERIIVPDLGTDESALPRSPALSLAPAASLATPPRALRADRGTRARRS